MHLEKEESYEIYRMMRKIRLFEEKASQLFAGGKMPGFIHVSLGQESIAVGVCLSLRKDDFVVSNHRGHGHMIAKGADIRYMMAELFGKAEGYCKGRSGSMHISDFDVGVLGANGVVGGGLPIANGAGFSAKYRGTDQVVACFFGDGATNHGTFHESLNLAALWKLPVIFVCENNGWSEFTSQANSMCITDISIRAQSYGMPGQTFDGIDVWAVMDATEKAVLRARAGKGPTLLEFKTNRWHGHFEGDPQKYRNKDELEKSRSQDPIEYFAKQSLKKKFIELAEIEKVNQEVLSEVEEAVKYAQESSLPNFDDEPNKVYA
jgi:TPP-dependent pyruvate/acetoin dehydrogenase alpha subunit